jgi:hypothetical protein
VKLFYRCLSGADIWHKPICKKVVLHPLDSGPPEEGQDPDLVQADSEFPQCAKMSMDRGIQWQLTESLPVYGDLV